MTTTRVLYYFGGCTLAGYFLMKLVERDPETLRKKLPEGAQLDYHSASQQRTSQFLSVLQNAAAGDDPETASRKLRDQLDKEKQKNLAKDTAKSS